MTHSKNYTNFYAFAYEMRGLDSITAAGGFNIGDTQKKPIGVCDGADWGYITHFSTYSSKLPRLNSPGQVALNVAGVVMVAKGAMLLSLAMPIILQAVLQ